MRSLPVALLVLCVVSCPNPSNAQFGGLIDTVTGWFESDEKPPEEAAAPPPEEAGVRNIYTYSPMTANTAYVLRYALALEAGNFSDKVVEFPAGEAHLFSPVDGDLVIVFSAPGEALTTSSEVKAVPFLRPFVYTAAGPAALVDAFSQLLSVGGATTGDGPLADAVEEVAGGDAKQLRLVTCTGADTGGMQLAVLCGPWAALRYPRANVNVVAFGAGAYPTTFNAPFAWAWQQLVTLHYLWPFELSAVQPNTSIDDAVLAMAAAVNPLITPEAVAQSIRVPNLPAFVPEQYQDWDEEDPLGALGPDPTLSPELQLPESDCPVILCKTREALSLSCLGFGKGIASGEDVLEDLPSLTLKDPTTDGDALVAWNESDATLYLLFKYTEERQDWLINAQVFQSEDFTTLIQPFTQAAEGDRLSELVPDVEVHSGFLKQFQSLALDPIEGGGESCMELVPMTDLLQAVCNLTGGAEPLRIVSSGFSLGGALSELAGVWASQIWPTADITVANQGAPIVGDENFVILAQATFGRAYKYVYRLDQVPSIPPLPDYVQTNNGLWITNGSVILQDRPELGIRDTNWDDHTCDVYTVPETQEEIIGYVPQVFNATRVAVPAWVYTAQPAPEE